MDQKTGFASLPEERPCSRRSGTDRRAYDDRRRSGGLFEVRARRDGIRYDRRRGERREQRASWLAFWRR